jgi:hypothetical protein
MSKIHIDNLSGLDCTAVPCWVWSLPVSFRAKGLFCFLLTCADGFLPSVAAVQAATGLGRDARRSAYRELQNCGLLATRCGTLSLVRFAAVLS